MIAASYWSVGILEGQVGGVGDLLLCAELDVDYLGEEELLPVELQHSG